MPKFKYRGSTTPREGQEEGTTDGQGKHRLLYTRLLRNLQSKSHVEGTFSLRQGPKYLIFGICARYMQRRPT